MGNEAEKKAFINWLLWVKKVAPALYALFKVKHPDIIEALDNKRLGFVFDWGTVFNAASTFVQTALPIYQQKKQFEQQLKLAKIQAQAPAGYTQPVAATPTYQAVAVPTSTPNTTATPVTTTSGQQMLEIRIDKGQLPEVNQQIQSEKFDLQKVLPYISIGLIAFTLFRGR